MPSFRRATVADVLLTRPGLQRVRLSGGDRAYVLTRQIGPVAEGDEVIINTTAVDLDLGTGGWHVIHWNLSRTEWSEPGPGHIMKMRYTSLQTDTGSAEEGRKLTTTDLRGQPVVVCGLHSQVGVVAVALRHLRPDARIAYVMTDGAALPLALSDLMVSLTELGVVDQTITSGHAFGGDLEAVSIPSALLLAADDNADVTIVGMGPGVVGTGSRFGNTAVEVASICDSVDALGGQAVLCVRASSGDARPRHLGISHHSLTALELVRSQPSVFVSTGQRSQLDGDRALDLTEVDTPAMGPLLERIGVRITTMGRDHHADELFFATASAAAVGALGLDADRAQ